MNFRIKLSKIEINKGQIEGVPSNPRQWKKAELEKLKASIQEDPDMMEARPLLVYQMGETYVVIGGNMRYTAVKQLGWKDVPCYVITETVDVLTLKRWAIKDNGSFGEWDMDMLANEWDDLPLTDWGVPAWDTEEAEKGGQMSKEEEEDEIERMRKEFQARMEAGELSEDDEEYQEFLAKFEAKKTTDDCYTPDVVYEAVANWVSETYKVSRTKFVRPFYPGGDYENEKYPAGCVVVDNPPFSILSEILKFYDSRSIPFFLFAPTLTLFSSSSSSSSTAIPISACIVYANGASVNTSFLTSLGDRSIRVMSSPSLYKAVKEANDANLATMRKSLPKYSYDHHIITSPFVGALSRLGINFVVPVAESEPISHLDAQKESGKTIFGKGYIVSDRVFAEREKAEREKAEREKAEREKAEREKAERWELSPKERAIIERLNRES